MFKLDFNLKSPEERKAVVEQIIAENDDLTPAQLEILADYLIFAVNASLSASARKEILTENRKVTIDKRECSFEGLAGTLENGEDGVYSMAKEDKNAILCPKISITQQDVETIPFLRQLRTSIADLERLCRSAVGKKKYYLRQNLIDLRRDQYVIKQAYTCPVQSHKLTHNTKSFIPLDDLSLLVGSKLEIKGVSLMDSRVIQGVLSNYSRLKEDAWGNFEGDLWYFMEDFDQVCGRALKGKPIYQRILELKIDGIKNADISRNLLESFNKTYTPEYISIIWRTHIPRLLAQTAKEDYLAWEYERRGYPLKRCTKCGELKPSHLLFFSPNYVSPDGWYSICKKCRNKGKGC